MRVTIDGQRRDLRTQIGEGGQAHVYKFKLDGKPHAVKVYKGPNDASFAGNTSQDARNRDGAVATLRECKKKLEAFPRGLSERVSQPRKLVYDGKGAVIGYTAHFVPDSDVLRRYSELNFRQGGIDTNRVIEILCELHDTIDDVNKRGVVIGDNNDLNVLISLARGPFLIDVDSFQYGQFACYSFTQRFADPLLCDPKQTRLLLCKPHTADSDIYAFNVMAFQSLLYVTPYDGIYRAKSGPKVPHDARPLHRITLLRDDVKYPKWAKDIIPPEYLPDDLMHHFAQVFHDDKRGSFPVELLRSLRFTKCDCGAEHARAVCPQCTAPGVVKEVVEVKGIVTTTRKFRTKGVILCAVCQDGKMRWLYHEGDEFKREDGSVVLRGALDPRVRYRIQGDLTCLAKDNSLHTFARGSAPLDQKIIDTYGVLPVYDANDSRRYFLRGGRLLADETHAGMTQIGERQIGEVIEGRTLFWVGDDFGFGFYAAGELNQFFVFNANAGVLRDGLQVPRFKGHMTDTTAVFSTHRCWFFATYSEGGQTFNRCTLLNAAGEVLGHTEDTSGGDGWLGSIRGKCAVGNFLFAATDEGIVRVELQSKQLVQTRAFPDTEPFVDSGCQLFQGKGGLYVVTRNEVRELRIN